MADTNFIDQVTQVVAAWANDVNIAIYRAIGTGVGGTAPTTPAAVRTNLGLTATGGAGLVGATATTNNAGATVQAQLSNLGSATGANNSGFTPPGAAPVATTVGAFLTNLSVLNLTALRAVAKGTEAIVYVQSTAALGDGGGGWYYYVSSDTTSTDNGFNIIVASDGGRYYLIPPTMPQLGNNVSMFRYVNSTNSVAGKWIVVTPTGILSTGSSTTQGVQEAIDYCAQFGYDLYIWGAPVAAPNWPPPYTTHNGQEPSIIFCTTGIVMRAMEKGIIKFQDVTLNFSGAVTGAAITMDTTEIADIDFSGSQVVAPAAATGILIKPTGATPADPAADASFGECRVKFPAVVVGAGATAILFDGTNGPISAGNFDISEVNGGANGVLVNPGTHGFIGNKMKISDCHLQTSWGLLLGTNGTNGLLCYGNQIDIICNPATGGAAIDCWGIDNEIRLICLNNQGNPALGVKFESSATRNQVTAGRINATALWQDVSTAHDNIVNIQGHVATANPGVGASPFTYQNQDAVPEAVTISGGTVSAIAMSVDNVTFVPTGVTQGVFMLQPGWYLRITHTGAPSMWKLFQQ